MVSQDMVEKVGAAVGKVALIQREFAENVERKGPMANRDALAAQADKAVVDAIDALGISVEDYNAVVSAAEGDAELEERLIEAARAVL
jgi:hypothetical protein